MFKHTIVAGFALVGALGISNLHARPSGTASEQVYFSPGEDLGAVDRSVLRKAQRSIKIAMYSFTDRWLAEELVQQCRRGISVLIYRDRQQYEEEEARRAGVPGILRGCSGIHIRVKGSYELMHLKAYEVDDSILRDGSANWSVSAVRYQDNEISIVSDSAQLEHFKQVFSGMWERVDNRIVQ